MKKIILFNSLFLFLLLVSTEGICQNIQWTSSNMIHVGSITKISEAGDGTLYALSDSGVIISTDMGKNWAYTPMRIPMDISGQVINGFDVAENGTIYLAIGNFIHISGILEISKDKGSSWQTNFNTPLQKFPQGLGAIPGGGLIAKVPNPLSTSGNIIPSLFRTIDDGNTWDSINLKGLSLQNAWDFNLSKYGRIFLAGDNVAYSDDSGKTWNVSSKVKTTTISIGSLTMAKGVSSNPSEFFIASNTGVYFSGDTGNTWVSLNTGLFDITTTGIAIDNRTIDTKENIFVSTLFSGVFASNDKGLNWHQVNNGLTNTYITSLFLSKDNILYAGSTDRIFRTNLILSVSEHPGKSVDKIIINPNPTSSKTTFSFTLPQEEFTTLKIYNPLGNEEATVINKRLPAGDERIEFDASHLPSGVYYYRLQIGGQVETKPMIVAH